MFQIRFRFLLFILCSIVPAIGPVVTPHHAFAHESVSVIRMTDNGFEPREIEIDVNATVRFINEDDVDRWPASNLHPTHTIYPEFDPKEPVAPKKIWEFQPKKVGSWKYHDHLFPHVRGTLTVTKEERNGEPVASQNVFETIKKFILQIVDVVRRQFSLSLRSMPNVETFRAMEEKEQFEVLRRMAATNGSKAAWQFVVTAYTNEKGASQGSGRAHDLAHFVGSFVYQKEGVGGLGACDPTFAFGCFHGFTEAAFTEKLDLLGEIATACTALGPVRSGPWASCIHGIGHGVATYFDTIKLDDALSTCDKLGDGQPYCYDGVFMEFSINAPNDFWNDHDPTTLCVGLDQRYRSACGRSLPFLLTTQRGMNPTDAVRVCLSMRDQDIAYSCIDATGLRIGQESGGNIQAIMQSCATMPTEQTYAHCATAAAGELIFQNYQGWEASSYQICSALPATYRESCFERTRRVSADYRQ